MGTPLPDPAALAALSADAAAVALGLASHSRHPLSRELARALAARGIRAAPLELAAERPGEGVFGEWLGLAVALRRPEAAQGTAVALEIEGQPARVIGFADRLRPDTQLALARMAGLGISCSILSGDNAAAVADAARETGLAAQAGASPADKQDAIGALRAAEHKVLMVGDGLNDGPALAAADASMAPGAASEVGLQAADLVFVQESLVAVPIAVVAARKTMRVVRQNFALAIGYNVIAVPLAIAGVVTPLIAAAAMSGSSLIVIANSLRLAKAAR